MVIALVTQRDLRWLIELAQSHGHSVELLLGIEAAVSIIRSGEAGIEAVLVDAQGADEAQRRRLKRIARQAGIPAEQVMIRDPGETSAKIDIRQWLEALT